MVKAPLASVVAPPVWALTLIDTLDRGWLLSDATVPLTVILSWANEKWEALKKRRNKNRSFLLCSKNANCFFNMAAELGLKNVSIIRLAGIHEGACILES